MLDRQQLGVLAASLAALSMWLYVARVLIPHQQREALVTESPRGNLSDLYPRWLGTRELLLHGRDPYGADITREIQAGYYGRPIDTTRPHDPKDQQALAYPVYVVIILGPTVRWPFPAVQRVFLVVFVVLTAVSVLLWLDALVWRVSISTKLLWILLVLGSFPAIQGLKLQQLTLLVAGLLAAAVCLVTRGHLTVAGILLAFATVKPQLAAMPVLWLCIWIFGKWRERQRLGWSFAASMAVLFIVGEALLPGWIGEFRTASAAYYRYTGSGNSVLDVFLTPRWGRIASVVVVGACCVLLWRVRRRGVDTPEFHWSLALVMATSLVIIPMFAPYNQVLLLPTIMVVVRASRQLWEAGRWSRFMVVIVAFSVFWQWVAASALVIATAVLPRPAVWKFWGVPLYTTLAIPVTVLALVVVGGTSAMLQKGIIQKS